MSIDLDEAMDRVIARLRLDPDSLDHPCDNGHYECTWKDNGPCLGEEIAAEFAAAEGGWCLHCGTSTCEHMARHNAAYGGAS